MGRSGVLTESKDAQAYWRKLKQRLKAEGNETVTNCHGLKMRARSNALSHTRLSVAFSPRLPAKHWNLPLSRESGN